MLDAFIIEELRRREREERSESERPRLELPLHEERYGYREVPKKDEDTEGSKDRGVIVIDF